LPTTVRAAEMRRYSSEIEIATYFCELERRQARDHLSPGHGTSVHASIRLGRRGAA
jgi:hypothetical protein